MSNKILSRALLNATGTADTDIAYLDAAAELSVLGRKNHHQTSSDGKPLVFDMLVKITAPTFNNSNEPYIEGYLSTVPANWQTRNSVRMAHFLREEQREEAGVSKESIGRYAKTLRFNMDSNMFAVPYDRRDDTRLYATGGTQEYAQRLFAEKDFSPFVPFGATIPDKIVTWSNLAFTGGVWDYSQLAQFTEDPTSGVTTGDPFYLNLCGVHSSTAPGPYTYVGVLEAYNQRRQTTMDSSTVTSGGDTQFIVSDSPFFRIPIQDVGEDSYVDITLDEQDNPPYDRAVVGGDSITAQPVEWFQLGQTGSLAEASFRVQAPLGLLSITMNAADQNQWVLIETEVLGTYEM